jgi:RHS repeat-associated protein
VTRTNNRLLEDPKYRFDYDLVGNRTKRTDKATSEVTEYAWDIRDRLTGITVKNAGGAVIKSANYKYDVYDQRISKTVDADGAGVLAATTERYVYGSNQNIALEFDGNNNLTHRYLFGDGIDQIEADESNGTVLWGLVDHLGSVRDVVENSGTVKNHISYDSFGNITSQTDSSVVFRYGYTGREFDRESGQYYYRSRYYDPSVGKFISEDLIGFGGGDANLSRYVFNKPITLTDPTGTIPIAAFFLVPIIAAQLNYIAQTIRYDGDTSQVNGFEVGVSAVTALLGLGAGGVIANVTSNVIGQIALNVGAGGGISASGQLAVDLQKGSSSATTQANVLNSGLLGALFSGLGSSAGSIIDKIGAAKLLNPFQYGAKLNVPVKTVSLPGVNVPLNQLGSSVLRLKSGYPIRLASNANIRNNTLVISTNLSNAISNSSTLSDEIGLFLGRNYTQQNCGSVLGQAGTQYFNDPVGTYTGQSITQYFYGSVGTNTGQGLSQFY